MDRIAIEKGSVQETLVSPLYARHVLAQMHPELYDGVDTGAIVDRVDYDFRDQKRLMDTRFGQFGALEVAQREYDLCEEARAYLAEHPQAAVVNMGAGLLDVFSRVDNGMARGYNLYFPDVIAVRELGPWSDRFASVTARSYMNGYRPLGRRYGLLNALLAKLSDSLVHMSIVRVEFAR